MIERQADTLLAYDFGVVHIAGAQNILADALSYKPPAAVRSVSIAVDDNAFTVMGIITAQILYWQYIYDW